MSEKDDSINQVLARNLAYWMRKRELTQAALAEKAGVSQKTISNYLHPGQRTEGATGKPPSAKLTELERIAGALHVDVWQLLREMSPEQRMTYEAIEGAYAALTAPRALTFDADQQTANDLRELSISQPQRKPKPKRKRKH